MSGLEKRQWNGEKRRNVERKEDMKKTRRGRRGHWTAEEYVRNSE
jgi:hypothetical protein